MDHRQLPINVEDYRLNSILRQAPDSCATINEYAAATGISTDRVMELFAPYLEDGSLAIEIVGDQLFLNTSPQPRLASAPLRILPNAWEYLREGTDPDTAYALWRLARQMERSGWRVEVSPAKILFGLGPIAERPRLGIVVGIRVVPVVAFPTPDEIASQTGPLGRFEQAQAPAVAITCAQGALDTTITGVRRYILARAARPPKMNLLILEAPQYNPTLVSPHDAAIPPRAVSREALVSSEYAFD